MLISSVAVAFEVPCDFLLVTASSPNSNVSVICYIIM